MSNEKLSIENIGRKLRQYRNDHNLTLAEMVERLACDACKSSGFLSEVERGVKKANASMVFSFEKLLNALAQKALDAELINQFEQIHRDNSKSAEPGVSEIIPDPSRMTFEQKLKWVGLGTKDIRQMQEWKKLDDEEQDDVLINLTTINIKKGR